MVVAAHYICYFPIPSHSSILSYTERATSKQGAVCTLIFQDENEQFAGRFHIRCLSLSYLVARGFSSLYPGYACFLPPYVIQPQEISFLTQVAWEGISTATR